MIWPRISQQQESYSSILRPALPPPNYINNAYQQDVSQNRSNNTNSTNGALQNTLPPILPRIAPAGPLPLPPTPQSRPRPSRPKYKIKTDKTAWTADEDNLLRLAVQLYGDRSERWTKIAACVPGRTNKMCRKRWFHSLDPNLRKGPWTEEEDELLRKAVEKHNRVWCKVAEFIPGRTDDQCAKRWKECLDPDIDHTEWTSTEDNLLISKYDEFGSQWQQIAQFFPGRPGLHCRNRWRKIQRLKKANKDHTMDMVINIITPNDITTPSSSSPHISTSSLSTSLHSTPQNMHSTMQQNMQHNLQSLQSNTHFNLSTNNVQTNVQHSNTQPHLHSRSSPIMSRQNVNMQQQHVHSNLQQQQHLQPHLLDNNPSSNLSANLQSDSDLHSHMATNIQANLSPKFYIPNYPSNSNLNVPTTDMHSNMLSNLSSNLTTNPTSSISSSIAPSIENEITSDTISNLPSTSSNGRSIASLLSSPSSSNNQMNLDLPTDQENSQQQPSQGTEVEITVKAYGCGVSGCVLTFTNANGLYYHMKAAHPTVIGNDKPYRCAWVGCAKKYKNINGLSYHLDTAKGSSGHKYDTEEGTNEVADKPYKCPVVGCKNRYLTANGLQYHERSIHGKDPDKYRGPHKANSQNNQGLQINQRFNDSNPQTTSNMEVDNNVISGQQQWMGNDAFRSSNSHETNPNEQNQALPMFNDNPIDVTNMLDINSSQFNDPQNQNGQNIPINTLLSITSTSPKYKCRQKGCEQVFTSTNDINRHITRDHHPNSHPTNMRQYKKPVKRAAIPRSE
ncbi:19616_t:CDS:2 [Funneliformis geosporum]|uniref:9112_t:CDS:1 n=1 Tax=Funneliformis geosporum TaxID=1117311 RepID=A0A9W4SR86_9GLOM|nr:19616_t:CDS:2 [Funneliformis geosporum]CAI2176228.1 9112_t:CDS:2 [Funneliformis geosporum]